MTDSIWWSGTTEEPRVPSALPAGDHDVVVVGAGLTGLTTAWLLAREGLSVCVVEARHPGAVTTGRSTAKASALQGTMLSTIARAGRWEALQAYVESTLRAQAWLREHAGALGASLEERDAVTYAADASGVPQVEEEARVALDLGLPVSLDRHPDLPVPAAAAVRLVDQLQLDPVRLVHGLVDAATAAGVVLVTGHRMRHVKQRQGEVRVTLADGGELKARHVVVATGAATLDRRLHFARVTAQRSYLLAYAVPQEPMVMGLSTGSSSRSFRGAVVDGRRVLLAGGAGHVTGRGPVETSRVDQLRAWVAEHWPGAEELRAWSAQDYTTTDHLPLVGSLGGPSPDVHLATGFNKWGITSGVAAALSVSGSILGRPEPWTEPLYGRRARLRDVPAVAGMNLGVARGELAATARLATDPRTTAVRALGGDCRLLPVCTHLGGTLRWNPEEESYDCPLHGSRFDADGEVLEGPATRRLKRL